MSPYKDRIWRFVELTNNRFPPVLAEMRTKAVPASIQSVPNNGNNQDVNTMGTIAARKAASCLEDLASIFAIHALCVVQGVDLIEAQKSASGFSLGSIKFHGDVRTRSKMLAEDRPLSGGISAVAGMFLSPEFE